MEAIISPAEAFLLCWADKLMRENTAYIDTGVASSHGDTERDRDRGRRGDRETDAERRTNQNSKYSYWSAGEVREARRGKLETTTIYY